MLDEEALQSLVKYFEILIEIERAQTTQPETTD